MAMAMFLAAGAATTALMGVRQARRLARERQAILSSCLGSLCEPRPSLAPDGYPRLSGRLGRRRCSLAVIPDSLELRRLPQLWLTVAISSSLPLPRVVVTARPRGDDYVSKAFDYPRQIEVPAWLPRDAMVRIGEGLEPDLARLREPLAALFEDPLVKELSLGSKGFRLVYRLAEGERGSHLLLRQCRFTARVDSALLESLVARCAALESALAEPLADAA